MLPVIEALVRGYPALLLSMDTVKAAVARAALDAGAAVVNDVSALRLDPAHGQRRRGGRRGARADALARAPFSRSPSYTHADVRRRRGRRGAGGAAGGAGRGGGGRRRAGGDGDRSRVRLLQDRRAEHLLLDQLEALQALGRPVLVGPSRKRFLGAVTGLPVEARDRATATACALAWERGARLFRVHDVAAAREALALAQALGGP